MIFSPLTIVILLFASSIIAYILGKISGKAAGIFSTLVSLVSLVMVIFLLFPGGEMFSFSYNGLMVNSLTVFIAFIPAFLGFLSLLYSISYVKDNFAWYYAFTLMFIGSMIGLAFSWNLLWMYILLELTTITSAILVAHKRDEKSFEAALKYAFQCFFAGFLALIGIVLLYTQTGTLNILELQPLTSQIGLLSTILIMVGFGIKIPFILLHAWLPDAHAEAPSPVSCLLSGAMIKVGAVATFLPLFKFFQLTSFSGFNLAFCWLGVLTMIVGAFMALIQSDVKRLLAYCSVSQMGYVVVGLSLGTPLGVVAGLFHALNHAIAKGLLFLGAGVVEHETGTRNMDKLGGLAKNMPLTAATMIIASLGLAGIPLLNGFNSKWMIYEACIEAGQPLIAIVGMLVSVLTLLYLLKMVHSVFLGLKVSENFKNVSDPSILMVFPLLLLSSLCILFGVIPQLPIQLILVHAAKAFTPSPLPLSFFPIITEIGVWGPTYATLLMVLGLIVGFLLYRFSVKPARKIEFSDKFLPFTGGLTKPPYISIKEAKVPSKPFSFAVEPVSRMFKRFHTGMLNHYFAWIILFFLIFYLIFTFIGGY